VARHISNAGPKLFGPPDADDNESPQPSTAGDMQPAIAQSRIFTRMQPQLSEQTSQALAQAKDNREWNALFLSTPEFMYR